MPYKPLAIDEGDRSNQYRIIWLGVAGALFSAANLIFGMDNILSAVAFGAMAGGPLSVAFGSRTDEYLGSLMDVGLRWMSAALGSYLLMQFFLGSINAAHAIGFALGSGEMPQPSGTGMWLATDGSVAAIVLCLVFYAGFAYQYCQDHFIAADE